MTLVALENNRPLGNGRDGPHMPEQRRVGLGNTNPVAMLGSALGLGAPPIDYRKAKQRKSESPQNVFQTTTEPVFLVQSGEGAGFYFPPAETKAEQRAKVLRPEGQVVLFKKIIEDWGFEDREAATLLGFETASDIDEIYLGVMPVRQRDANDRLRTIFV